MQQFNQVIMMMEENMVVIREPKTFYFEISILNLKDEIEFIIKSNESLVENKKQD